MTSRGDHAQGLFISLASSGENARSAAPSKNWENEEKMSTGSFGCIVVRKMTLRCMTETEQELPVTGTTTSHTMSD